MEEVETKKTSQEAMIVKDGKNKRSKSSKEGKITTEWEKNFAAVDGQEVQEL